MGIVLAFVPFLLFIVVEQFVGITAGLVSAAVFSAALLADGLLRRHKTAKVLEIGTVILFVALAAYSCLVQAAWPIARVRLWIDAGLLLVVVLSIAIGRPFTLQYVREQVAPVFWNKPEFVRINYVITTVWAFAFAVMVAADLLLLYAPRLPAYVGILTTVAAMAGAVRFTSWYPAHRLLLEKKRD